MYTYSKTYTTSTRHPHNRLPVKKQRSLLQKRPLQLALTVVLLGFISTVVLNFNNGENQPTNEVLAASTQQSNDNQEPVKIGKPKKTVDTSTLQPQLDQIIKKYPQYDTSVSVVDLNSGTLVQSGDGYPFIAASTTKLLTAMLYLNNVETRLDGLNTDIDGKSAQKQLQLMINQSDNDAWRSMNLHLSKDSLAAYAKKQGLESYDPEKNTVTSNDMAKLLAKFYQRELLKDEHTKLLLSWMQNTSEERFIPAAVPNTSKIYHKAGYLSDRVHDVAIVDNGEAPFAIVIYSKTFGNKPYDYAAGQKLFKEATKTTLDIFNK